MARSTDLHGRRGTLRTITVRELIEALEDEDPDMPVMFTSNYGDYHNTPQVHALQGECEEAALEETAYSHSGWRIRDEDYDEERDGPPNRPDRAPRVLVII